MQFRAFDWRENLNEISIGEARKLNAVIHDDKVQQVMQAMKASLSVVSSTSTKMGDEEEESLVEPVTLFSSPSMWGRCHNDVKIYMEACLAHAQSGLPAQFLVNNDHRFFSIFLKSKIADDTFHSVVTDILGIQEGVQVKLTGELIDGL